MKRAPMDQIEYASFQSPCEFADFELKVAGTSFFVNQWYLAEKSPVFAALCFNAGFKEKAEKFGKIREENSEDILELLRCVCPCSPYLTPKPVTAANFGLLIRLADKFDVASLKAACEKYLKEEFDYIEAEPTHVIQMLMAADQFRLTKDAVAKLIARAATFDINTLKAHEVHKTLSNYVVAVLFTANGKYRVENVASSAVNNNSARPSSRHRNNSRRNKPNALWSTINGDQSTSCPAHVETFGSNVHLMLKTDAGGQAKFFLNCSICLNKDGRGTSNRLCLKCCQVLCAQCEAVSKCPKLVLTPTQIAGLRNKLPAAKIDLSMLD